MAEWGPRNARSIASSSGVVELSLKIRTRKKTEGLDPAAWAR